MCLSCRNDTGSGPGLVLRRTRPDAGWRGTKSQMRRAAIPSRAFLLGNPPVSGRNCTERTQGPRSMRAQRASVRISFWGDPRPGFPDLDRTNDGGAVRPRSCSLPSFGQRPVMHKVGGPPPSLCISVLTNQVREERKNRCIRMGGSDLRSWSVTTGSTRAHYRRLRRLDASC